MSQLKAVKKPDKDHLNQTKKIFVAGVGAVGSTLLKQISDISKKHDVRVIGVCNRRHVLWNDHSQEPLTLSGLNRGPEKSWDEIVQKLTSYEKGTVIFVDATGSEEVVPLYIELLKNHVHVVTPSKLANTQSQDKFDSLHHTARENSSRFLYETNVGAGLPIVNTIRNLVQTGDQILRISGVLSGTMTYLFSELDKGASFSETVIKARRLGYAEPDPRDDLSGEDVARKFLILARLTGLRLERDDLAVQTLIPKPLQDVDSTTFLNDLHKFDHEWSTRITEADQNGKTLRYVGTLSGGSIEVGIQEVSKSSALGQLSGTNNLVEIQTERYYDQPLVILGPGAGKGVTAAGLLSDILSI
jgi:aspartokinase/homoserine dehydrogenase 1